MTTKLILLTGAPEAGTLSWDAEGLLAEFQEPIARFAGLTPGPAAAVSFGSATTTSSPATTAAPTAPTAPVASLTSASSSAAHHAAWRSIPLRKSHMPTGFSQQPHLDLFHVPFFARHRSGGKGGGGGGNDGPHRPLFFSPAAVSFSTAAASGEEEEETTREQDVDPADDEMLQLQSQFYEHSLAAHEEELASSQLVPAATADTTTIITTTQGEGESACTSSSFLSSGSSFSRTVSSSDLDVSLTLSMPPPPFPNATTTKPPLLSRPIPNNIDGAFTAPPPITDLSALPPPSHLARIHPQIMTVTLVAGIISAAPERAVTTRWGGAASLVEVLVGDDTRAGFAVTFWSNNTNNSNHNNYNNKTEDRGKGKGHPIAASLLRPRDVVLLHNVALNAFAGRVYGSSLRRGLTRIYLLYRPPSPSLPVPLPSVYTDVGCYYDAADLVTRTTAAGGGGGGGHAQLEKTRRVWRWALDFVGRGGGGGEGEGGEKEERARQQRRGWDRPPPLDSQSVM